MERIIYFEENREQGSVIRFVKLFRKKRFLRKERVEYSIICTDAFIFEEGEGIPTFIAERINKDYPCAKVHVSKLSDFFEKYFLHRFFVIARHTDDGIEDYYCGRNLSNDIAFTQDTQEISMILAHSSAEETLRTIQQTSRGKVFIRTLYLNLVNELLTPMFLITCTGKGSGGTKFFSKLDGNRLRLVATSFAAAKFTYEDVLTKFTYLQTHNKNFLYAVLPVFKDNVNCRNIESYMRENNISRMVAMDLQLKHLNTRHA